MATDIDERPTVCRACGSTNLYDSGQCRDCRKRYVEKNKAVLYEKNRQYREANREQVLAQKREHWAKNKASINEDRRAARAEDPEKFRAVQRKSYQKNKEKVNLRSKLYYQANRERLQAKNRMWRLNNLERFKRLGAEWVRRNIEKKREIAARWARNHREYGQEIAKRRKGRKVGGRLSRGLVKRLWVVQRGKCACCGRPLGSDYHLDHIVPLARGGEHADHNMQLLRAKCNMQKGAKHPVDFMQSRGFLL